MSVLNIFKSRKIHSMRELPKNIKSVDILLKICYDTQKPATYPNYNSDMS